MHIDTKLDLQEVNSITELRLMPILGFKIPRINTVYMDKKGDADSASSCFQIAYRKDCLKDKLANWSESDYMDSELAMLYLKAAQNGCFTAMINVLPYLYMGVAFRKDSSQRDDDQSYAMAMDSFMRITEIVQSKSGPFSSYGDYWMAIAVGNQVLDYDHIKSGVDTFLKYNSAGIGINPAVYQISPAMLAKSCMESLINYGSEFAKDALRFYSDKLSQTSGSNSFATNSESDNAQKKDPRMQETSDNIDSRSNRADVGHNETNNSITNRDEVAKKYARTIPVALMNKIGHDVYGGCAIETARHLGYPYEIERDDDGNVITVKVELKTPTVEDILQRYPELDSCDASNGLESFKANKKAIDHIQSRIERLRLQDLDEVSRTKSGLVLEKLVGRYCAFFAVMSSFVKDDQKKEVTEESLTDAMPFFSPKDLYFYADSFQKKLQVVALNKNNLEFIHLVDRYGINRLILSPTICDRFRGVADLFYNISWDEIADNRMIPKEYPLSGDNVLLDRINKMT